MAINSAEIFVDFRESRSQVPKFLTKFGINFEMANLSVDYQIGMDYMIERKTIADFITSIGDGRLFRQVTDLADKYVNPLLLLEGGGLYKNGRVPANVIRGINIWIAVKQKVPLLRTFNEFDTACMLRLLVKKSSCFNRDSQKPLRYQKKLISPWQQQIKILAQIPGVGQKTAKDLLKFCGSITTMAQLADEDLINLPGLGEKRLKNFRQIFPSQSISICGQLPQLKKQSAE